MNSSQMIKRFQVLSLTFLFALILLQVAAPAQEEKPAGNLYSNEKYMYVIELPVGYSAWDDDATREFFQKSRQERELPEEFDELDLDKLPVQKTVFQPSGNNISNQSIVIHAGIHVPKSLDEFEATYNVGDMDFVTLSKETLTVNYRPCFLLDREFDLQGLRFRQISAFIQGLGPRGYLINFSAISVDFNEYRDKFMKSLKTFLVQPPKAVPGNLKQAKYSKKVVDPKEKKPAWKSIEVIGSFIIVAIIVIWFMLKRLSAGAAAQNLETLPGKPPGEDRPHAVEPPDTPQDGSDTGG